MNVGDETDYKGKRCRISYIDYTTDRALLEAPDGSVYQVGMDEIYNIVIPRKSQYSLFVCECGAEITYGKDTQFHAHYCPKYVKPQIT